MNTNERDIRKLIDDWTQALRAKDIRKMMAGYASDVVVFDMRLPHKITGADALEKQWMQGLPRIDGPVHCELTDLHVTAGDDVAFCRCFNRMAFTLQGGEKVRMCIRATLCFQKIDGRWRDVHEHASVPIDMATGKGVTDFEPE